MKKAAFLFRWLGVLAVAAVVASAGMPGAAAAGEYHVSASTGGSSGAAAAQEDALDCAPGTSHHQIHCHRVTPGVLATASARPSFEDDPGFALSHSHPLPRAASARIAVAAPVTLARPAPRFLFGSFRS